MNVDSVVHDIAMAPLSFHGHLISLGVCRVARATLEILIPDFVKQTAEEKPVEGDELEVRTLYSFSVWALQEPSSWLRF